MNVTEKEKFLKGIQEVLTELNILKGPFSMSGTPNMNIYETKVHLLTTRIEYLSERLDTLTTLVGQLESSILKLEKKREK